MFSRPSVDTQNLAFDPEAVYYRDPSARTKLRTYLASPQKFDEAVAYGFPSNETDGVGQRTSDDSQTFLKDESNSLGIEFNEEETETSDCATSEGDGDSPVTPADNDEMFGLSAYNRLSIFGSLDSSSLPSLELKFQPESIPSSPLANREMTLRMTLTRPDLRANDEVLYGWQREPVDPDPYQLEELPRLWDDPSGAHGAFAVKHPNRNSRVILQKIKKTFRRH
jgi:hypothetical protein